MKKFLFLILLCLNLVSLATTDGEALPEVDSWIKSSKSELCFTENKGQLADDSGKPVPFVLFKTSTPNLDIYITDFGLSYIFTEPDSSDNIAISRTKNPKTINTEEFLKVHKTRYNRVDMILNGATIIKENILKEGASNYYEQYFLGHCPSGISPVFNYKKITIKNIYPGIDWVIYSNGEGKGIEYDFIVHPGANANNIKLLYKGQLNLLTDSENKNLSITTILGSVKEGELTTYQGNENNKVESNYVIREMVSNRNDFNTYEVTIKTGKYDHSKELTIDPKIFWSTMFGGNHLDFVFDMTIDLFGNVYVVGQTISKDFPTQPLVGAWYQGQLSFKGDAYIVKFSNSGQLIWSTFYGGSGYGDGATSAVTDQQGNIFITGNTSAADFPLKDAGNGAFFKPGLITTNGGLASFVLKLNNAGQPLWSTYHIVSAQKTLSTIDVNGNFYVSGTMPNNNSMTIVTPAGAYSQPTMAGWLDAFINKFSNDGVLLWSTYLGGNQGDEGYAIATDGLGNLYLGGHTQSTNFPLKNPLGGAYYKNTLTLGGADVDAFISKFDATGAMVWSTYYGGNDDDYMMSFWCDKSNNLLVLGATFSTNFPLKDPGNSAYFQNAKSTPLNINHFISKFDPAGVPFWMTYYGGDLGETFNGWGYRSIKSDNCDNIYIGTATFSKNMLRKNPGCGSFVGINDYALLLTSFTKTGIMTWTAQDVHDDWTPSIVMDKNNSLFVAVQSDIGPLNVNPGNGAYIYTAPPFTKENCHIRKFIQIPFTATTTPTNASCGCNGSVTVNVSCGTPPYSYSWSNGQTTATATGLCAGTSLVTVTDAGCNNSTIPVNIGGTLSVTNTSSTEVCANDSNGTATVNVSGGNTTYTYSWLGTTNSTNSISGLAAGIYTCTITDGSGCSAKEIIQIKSRPAITAVTTSTSASCNNNNGSANVIAGNNYTYSWQPGGQTTNTISGISQGIYSVTITDSSNCSIIKTVAVGNTDSVQVVIQNYSSLICKGSSSGFAFPNISSGIAPYSYSWSSGETNRDASGLSAGTHTLTVTDASGCLGKTKIAITEAPVMVLSMSANNTTCGNKNGKAEVDINGGLGSYTYSWAPGGKTTDEIYNLFAGDYTVTVTDPIGCTGTKSVSVLNSNGPVITVQNQQNIVCGNDSTGSVTVIATGTKPPFTYLWNPTGATTANISNLTAGTYTLTVTDSSQCSQIKVVTISATGIPILASATLNNPSCNNTDGWVLTTVTGGNGPLSYSWSNGATTNNLSNVLAGIYTLTITDSSGCSADFSYTLNSGNGPTVLLNSKSDVLCFGNNSGSATVNVSNGKPPYVFSWSPSGGTAMTASGLVAGQYTVHVSDSSNCLIQYKVNITEPSALTLNFNISSASCDSANGEIDLNVNGGSPLYNYQWNNGSTSHSLTALSAGMYSVHVVDMNNCAVDSSVSITNTGSPSISVVSQKNATCFGNADGTVDLSVTGGQSPYTYLWSNGSSTASLSLISAGAYTFTVTDSTSCISTKLITITEPLPLTVGAVTTNDSCGNGAGRVTLNPSGGNGSYTYLWSNGATTGDIFGLVAGSYSVVVSDAAACTYLKVIQINNNGGGVPVLLSRKDVRCNGGADGETSVSISGGISPYSYSWSNGETTSTVSMLPVGTYTVTILDSINCKASMIISINEPSKLLVSLMVVDAACGNSNGSVNALVSGGTGAYSYLWNLPNESNNSISSLASGLYIVTVSDSNNCSITDSATVVSNNFITAVLTSQNASCIDIKNGQATITPISGSAPYTYMWSTIPPQTTSVATGLGDGVYFVSYTDINGCVGNDTVMIASNPSPVVFASNADTILKGDKVQLQAVGGNNYLWFPSKGLTCTNCANPIASPEQSTMYYVLVTDSNGCSGKDSVLITVKTKCSEFFIPSAFSPNDDGVNDILFVRSKCVKQLLFKVFNRWGELVFETTNINNGWDGKMNQQNLNDGIFCYKLYAITIDSEVLEKIGTVMLVR